MSSAAISWLNLHRSSSPLPLEKEDSLEYQQIPELFNIGQVAEKLVLFAPLLMRLYSVSAELLSSSNPVKLNPAYYEEWIKVGLFQTHEQIQKLYPSSVQDSTIHHIRLLMTNACNLNCAYCYGEAHRQGQFIDLTKLTALLATIPPQADITIEFHGNGEPTLSLDHLQKTREIVLNHFPQARFLLQTNGFFSSKTSEWILKHGLNTAFSIDGPPEIQNLQRPAHQDTASVFETILGNIRLFHSHNQGLAAITTITELSVTRLMDIYEFLKKLGMKHIKINPLVKLGKATTSNLPQQNPPEPSTFAAQYAKVLLRAYNDQILIDSDFIPSVHIKEPSAFRCGASSPQMVIDIDGHILACSDAYYLDTPEKNPFFWGYFSLHNAEGQLQLNKQKIAVLQDRSVHSMKACQECSLKWLCSGACLVENFMGTGSFNQPNTSFCEARKALMNTYLLALGKQIITQ